MAGIADGAHGVVTRQELIAVGVTRRQIEKRLQAGALLPEFPGVYRVGHRAPSVEARYMAAVRACGDDSMLGGLAAAYLLVLLRGAPPEPDVIAPREKRINGVKTRRCRNIDPRDRTIWRGIPVTSVARTLADLAAVLSEHELGRACHEAGFRHGTSPADVEAVLARRPTSPGEAAADSSRRRRDHPQRARAPIPPASPRCRSAASGDQQARRRSPRGLPLARAQAHRGARLVHVPLLAPRLGGRSPARTRRLRPRRRLPSLHPR
jgi:hypothetical protein